MDREKSKRHNVPAEPEFRAIFETLPDLYLILLPEPKFTIAASSHNLLTATATTLKDISGCPFPEAIFGSQPELNDIELSELRNTLQWVLKHKKGYLLLQKYYEPNVISGAEELRTRHWEILITPSLANNGALRFIVVRLTDAAATVRSREREEKQSLHTRALEELKRENMRRIQESKEQLEILNRSLEQSVAELEFANSELDSFCASVPHDLHALLRVIEGYSKILLEDPSHFDKDMVQMLSRVQHNAQVMNRQIDDLLSFSRLGKEELKMSAVDMTMAAKKVLEQALIENNRGVEPKISLHQLLPAKADRNMMGHVFTNLISNAIKYSSKSKNPEIEINSVALKGRNVYHVKDNGTGFDMKYADKLFGIFQRLHSREDYAGTGLGLALVKRIVVRHGGKVWAKSKPGKGASFYFSLPAGD